MDENQFVSQVRSTTAATTDLEAKAAIDATLRTLGERLTGGEPQDLAAQLPAAVAVSLPEQGAGERFDVEEFYQRVAEKEQCTAQEARGHARAVLAAVRSSVTGGEVDQVAEQLPRDYADLLQSSG